MTTDTALQRAVALLQQAEAVIITAGAGMGVDSGLPDFRGTEGFWNAYPPVAKLGLSFSDMANPRWFRTDPHLAWAFYGHRLNLYRAVTPHQGFTRLLDMAAQKPGGYFVFTSNVDGHFQAAGYDPDAIVECHGSIHHFQCVAPCCDDIWDAQQSDIPVDEDAFRATDPLPACCCCDGPARPNILMFGDGHWIAHRTQAQEQRLQQWLRDRRDAACVIVEIGAGQAVPTVRMTSEMLSRQLRAPLVRINPRDYDVPADQIGIPLGGAEGIARLLDAMH